MPINEPYIGSQARGYFQMIPQRLETVLEPREQVAIFDWDRCESRDLKDSFEKMVKVNIDWGTFINDTTNAYNQIWPSQTFTDNQIHISYPDCTTYTYIPEFE